MLQYDGVSELAKAAPKRLADAWELLEQPTRNPDGSDASYRHLCAAQYLAGYAVECALKVYIIRVAGARSGQEIASWSALLEGRRDRGDRPSLDGSSSHNLSLLLTASRLDPMLDANPDMKVAWALCCKWSPSLRYCPRPVLRRTEAAAMVQACTDIHRWLGTQSPR